MTSTSVDLSRTADPTANLAADHTWSDFDTCQLLDLARRSVVLGIEGKSPLRLPIELYSRPLQRQQSTFVTLREQGKVLTRAGTVRPMCPLASDVCHNAYEASRRAVQFASDAELTCDVQVVSPLRYLNASSREEVEQAMEGRQDGVLLQYGASLVTFTPDKWQHWPAAVDFLQALQRQAGLDPTQWQPGVRVATYQLTQLPSVKVYNQLQKPPAPKPR